MELNTNDLISFENICQILTKNPTIATKALEDFIKSDVVIEKCCIYLASTYITETGYFHALSCLHRATIIKWNIIPVDIKKLVKKILMNQLRSKLVLVPTISHLNTNKLMQVYISIWKRSWVDLDEDEKISFFGFISEQLRDKQTAINAAMILRMVIEEFSTQSYAESNIQYGFHIYTKKCFQKIDLLKVFELAVQPLCTLLAIIKTSFSVGEFILDIKAHMTLVSELSKLLIELLEWNFDDDGNPNKVDTSKCYRCSKLPREWHFYITSIDFIEVLFHTMQTLVQYSLNYEQSMGDHLYKSCLLNVRNLILLIPCIDGEIFHSFEEKMHYGNFFLNSLNVLVNPYCVRSNLNELLVTDNSIYDYVSGGTRQDMLDLFMIAMIRLIGNYKLENIIKLSNFETLVMNFGLISFELSNEMCLLSVFLIKEVNEFEKHLAESCCTASGCGGRRLSTLPKPSEVILFKTWRADILSYSLDLWSMMLDGGTVISESFFGLNTDVNVSIAFIQWLKELNKETFKLYSEVIMNNTIFETICEAEAENDDDNELIEARCIEDFFTGIGIVGRISFHSSLEDIYNSIYSNFNQLKALTQNTVAATANLNDAIKLLNQPSNNIKYLKYLEGCRVAIELLCYLLFETFHSILTEKDSEKPRINTYILFSLTDGSNSFSKLLETCNLLVEVLSVQINYMMIYCVDFPMVSPILMQSIYHFFNHLSICYIDVDPDIYGNLVSNYFIEQLNGNLWNPLLVQLYGCSYQTILLLPAEVELIKMVSSCIQSITLSRNQARLQHILQFNSILEISNLISTTHIGGTLISLTHNKPPSTTLLNPSCLSCLFEAISTLFLKANAEAHFNQLLVNTFNALQLQIETTMDCKVQFYHIISAMSGLAKCPKGFNSWLFDSSWTILRSSMDKYKEDCDDLLRQFLNLLLNIGEYQLLNLSNNSCMEMYRTTYEIMQIFSQRFQIAAAVRSEEENVFKSELSILLLDVLNTLSIKDFEFFDDDKSDQFQSFENEISLILINGLEILLPMITAEILENYARIAERLLSFITFLSGNYMVKLVQWMNQRFRNNTNLNNSNTTLYDLRSRLLWATSSVDGNIARMGFHSLQSLATHQWKCKFNRISNQDRIPLYQNDLFLQGVLEYFIKSIFYANNQNAILSWDRIDSFANVLITLIALDIEYYNTLIQSYIETKFSSFEENKFHFIINTLKHLSTDRNVDLQNIDKSNRMIFVLNFRDFVSQIKSTSFF